MKNNIAEKDETKEESTPVQLYINEMIQDMEAENSKIKKLPTSPVIHNNRGFKKQECSIHEGLRIQRCENQNVVPSIFHG